MAQFLYIIVGIITVIITFALLEASNKKFKGTDKEVDKTSMIMIGIIAMIIWPLALLVYFIIAFINIYKKYLREHLVSWIYKQLFE